MYRAIEQKHPDQTNPAANSKLTPEAPRREYKDETVGAAREKRVERCGLLPTATLLAATSCHTIG